jgi:putative transposase
MIPPSERRSLIDPSDDGLSVQRQLALLSVPKSTYYDNRNVVRSADLKAMRRLDELHLEDPTRGTRRMSDELRRSGFDYGRDRTRTLMRLMRMKVIYRRPRTTIIDPAAHRYPYLLRDLKILRSDQVWQIDISYLPMAKGFMYMVAIIDVYSRMIVGWDISSTMEAQWVTDAVRDAVERHGAPEIMNSDQGSQFTSREYISYLKSVEYAPGKKVRISMDGRGRATDNAYIERFWRTIKYERLYLEIPQDGKHLFRSCNEFIRYYNERRGHSSHGYRRPKEVYSQAA